MHTKIIFLTSPYFIANYPKNTNSSRRTIGNQKKITIQPYWQFNFIDFSRVTQQRKVWFMNAKDLFGNKLINSHNSAIAYILTSALWDLWNICTSCRNTSELQSLINSLWFLFFIFLKTWISIWQNIFLKPGLNSKCNI